MRYMANINLRLDNSQLALIDKARGKQPRLSWLRDAIDEKLGAKPSILAEPMIPHAAVKPLRGGAEKPPVSNPVVPMPAAVKAAVRTGRYQVAEADCLHRYRDAGNRCFACGQMR